MIIGRVHATLAYLVTLVAQVTVAFGIYSFFDHRERYTLLWTLLTLNATVWFLIMIGLEINHQRILRQEVAFKLVSDSMNIDEFNERVRNGEKLVIFDEYVLDVSKFIEYHPGGRFVLTHNIGRDISKFFYGGYSLDGNLRRPNKPTKGHVHSNYARRIVNECIVAHFNSHLKPTSQICRVKQNEIYIVNDKVKTFYLETINKKTVTHFKRFYPGLDYI